MPLATPSIGRARIFDLWCGNHNVYILANYFQSQGFQTNHSMHPNVQQGSSCGYIAAQAATCLHTASDWYHTDIMTNLTSQSLIPQYNAILGSTSNQPTFLTDDEIMTILHHIAGTPQGLPWLQALVPMNYFVKTLERRIARRTHHNQLFITIVNTTCLSGPMTLQPVGDHWICVAYKLSPQLPLN